MLPQFSLVCITTTWYILMRFYSIKNVCLAKYQNQPCLLKTEKVEIANITFFICICFHQLYYQKQSS